MNKNTDLSDKILRNLNAVGKKIGKKLKIKKTIKDGVPHIDVKFVK